MQNDNCGALVPGVAHRRVGTGGAASALEQNAAKWEDSHAAVALAQKTYGALHLAVDNAGIGAAPQTICDDDIAAWHRVRAVDLDTPPVASAPTPRSPH